MTCTSTLRTIVAALLVFQISLAINTTPVLSQIDRLNCEKYDKDDPRCRGLKNKDKDRPGTTGKSGVRIKGKVKQTTIVGKNTNVAVGKGAKAVSNIGVIKNNRIKGTSTQTTIVGNSTDVAVGKGGKAVPRIGSIGSVNNNVTIGQGANVVVTVRNPVLNSVYGFLGRNDPELKGYGLYTYVLLPSYSGRGTEFLKTLFSTTGARTESLLLRNELNIIYLPTREGRIKLEDLFFKQSVLKQFAEKHYDYSAAHSFLARICRFPGKMVAEFCEEDLSRGPYLLTYGEAISSKERLGPPYLLVDLSNVHIHAFGEFLAAYKAQVKRPEYSDRDRVDGFRLQLLNVTLKTADLIDPIKDAVAEIIQMVDENE